MGPVPFCGFRTLLPPTGVVADLQSFLQINGRGECAGIHTQRGRNGAQAAA